MLSFSENLLGIALFTVPIQRLTGNPVVTYNLAYLASYVLAGGGMYLLASSLTGSRRAAAVAGVLLSLCRSALKRRTGNSHLVR